MKPNLLAFSLAALLFYTFAPPSFHAAEGDISTVAGDGTASFGGDGGAATSAQLYNPDAVAIDDAGNIFVADQSNNRIRKVDTSGNISTVAGDGAASFGGDGGAATSAKLNNPIGVAVDAAGNLYIADFNNNRIRKVDTSGNISTVAGDGTGLFGGDGGAATSAQLKNPTGVAIDDVGNLYIADYGNNRIRKVDTSGNISTVAGDGNASFGGDGGSATSAQLNSPQSVTVDDAGNLYIADFNNHRIRKVDTSGNISTVAGDGTASFGGDGGAATSAQLNLPTGVTIDAAGNLFIADYVNHRIRKVDTSGNISTVAGDGTGAFGGDGGPATSAQLNGPRGAALDKAGNLYIADQINHRVRKVERIGKSPPSAQPLQVDTWSQYYNLANYYYGLYAAYGYYDYAAAYYYYHYGLGYSAYYFANGNPGLASYYYYGYIGLYYLYIYGTAGYTYYYYYLALAYYHYYAAIGDYNSAYYYYNAFIAYAFGG